MYPELNKDPDIDDKWVFPSRHNYKHFQSKIFNRRRPKEHEEFVVDSLFGHGFIDMSLNGNDYWVQHWVPASSQFIAWCDLMHSIRTR